VLEELQEVVAEGPRQAAEGQAVQDHQFVGQKVQAGRLARSRAAGRIERLEEGSARRLLTDHQHLGRLLRGHPQGERLRVSHPRRVLEGHRKGGRFRPRHGEPQHEIPGQVGPGRRVQARGCRTDSDLREAASTRRQQQFESHPLLHGCVLHPQGLEGNPPRSAGDLEGQGDGPSGLLQGRQFGGQGRGVQQDAGPPEGAKAGFQVADHRVEPGYLRQGGAHLLQTRSRLRKRHQAIRKHDEDLPPPPGSLHPGGIHPPAKGQVAPFGQQQGGHGQGRIGQVGPQGQKGEQPQADLAPVQASRSGHQPGKEPDGSG